MQGPVLTGRNVQASVECAAPSRVVAIREDLQSKLLQSVDAKVKESLVEMEQRRQEDLAQISALKALVESLTSQLTGLQLQQQGIPSRKEFNDLGQNCDGLRITHQSLKQSIAQLNDDLAVVRESVKSVADTFNDKVIPLINTKADGDEIKIVEERLARLDHDGVEVAKHFDATNVRIDEISHRLDEVEIFISLGDTSVAAEPARKASPPKRSSSQGRRSVTLAKITV